MTQEPSSPEIKPKPEMKLLLRGVFGILLLLTFLGGVLFLSAGTTDWRSAWVLIGLYGIFLFIFFFYTAFRDPELLKERGKKSANVKPWDKVIAGIYNFLLIAMLIVCGLDVGRFRMEQRPSLAAARRDGARHPGRLDHGLGDDAQHLPFPLRAHPG